MRRFVPLALCGAALVALVVALVLALGSEARPGSRDDSIAGSGVGGATRDRAPEADAAVVELAGAPGASDPSGASDPVPTTSADRLGAGGVQPARADDADDAARVADAVLVRVVLAGPAPDGERARVWLVTDREARRSWSRSVPELRERARGGERFDVDAEGRAWIPRQAQDYRLAAETGTHWGWRDVAADAREVEIVAEHSPALRVRVVDTRGAAVAGVRLEIVLAGRGLSAVTGADGVARVDDVLARVDSTPAFDMRVDEALVVVDAPLAEELVVPFDPEDLAEPVEITLPPHGSVEIHVQAENGEPIALREGRLRLETAHAAVDELLLPYDWWPEDAWECKVAGSIARVPAVALGRRFRVVVSGDGLPGESGDPFAGPASAGERVVVPYVIAKRPRLVEVRVLDEDGSPYAGKYVIPRLEAGAGGVALDRTGTDPLGRLRVGIPETWAPETEWTLVLAPRFPAQQEARLRLPAELAVGVTDAGDAELFATPLCAAGVVRDDAGEPISLATIAVEIDGIELPHARTNGAGTFDVHGSFAEGSRAIVRASRAGFASAVVRDVAPGASGIELVLERLGTLEVHLRAPEGLHPGDVRAEALRDGAVQRLTWRGYANPPSKDLPIFSAEVATGLHDVRVLLDGLEIALVPGVRVRAGGGQSRDPRLDPIDLVEFAEVQVRLRSNAKDLSGAFRWRVSGTARWSAPRSWEDPVLRIFSPTRSIDLEIAAGGHRGISIQGASGKRELALVPGVPVRVKVPAAAEPISRGTAVGIGLYWQGNGLDTFQFVPLGPGGEATVRCAPGSYRPTFPNAAYAPDEDLFEVLDVEHEQVFVLDALSARLEQALREDR